jgi:ABC-type antimicrobial peptide transport system permease subunit
MLTAVVNGTFRVTLLDPRLGEPVAHIVSSLMLSLFILLLAWVLVPWAGPRYASAAFALGGLWLLTLPSSSVSAISWRMPWRELLADYNIAAGASGCLSC